MMLRVLASRLARTMSTTASASTSSSTPTTPSLMSNMARRFRFATVAGVTSAGVGYAFESGMIRPEDIGLIPKSPPLRTSLLLSPEQMSDVARSVSSKISLSFLPPSVAELVIARCLYTTVEFLSRGVSSSHHEDVQRALNDQLHGERLNTLVKKLAHEINVAVDLPLLDEEQEGVLFEIALLSLFSYFNSDVMLKARAADVVVKGAKQGASMIIDPQQRNSLLTTLERDPILRLIPAPLLTTAISSIGAHVDRAIPPDWRMALSAAAAEQTPAGIAHLRAQIIKSVNAAVDLPGLDEDQEAAIIGAVVDAAMAQMSGNQEREEKEDVGEGAVARLKALHERELRLAEQGKRIAREAEERRRRWEEETRVLKAQIKEAQAAVRRIR